MHIQPSIIDVDRILYNKKQKNQYEFSRNSDLPGLFLKMKKNKNVKKNVYRLSVLI